MAPPPNTLRGSFVLENMPFEWVFPQGLSHSPLTAAILKKKIFCLLASYSWSKVFREKLTCQLDTLFSWLCSSYWACLHRGVSAQ